MVTFLERAQEELFVAETSAPTLQPKPIEFAIAFSLLSIATSLDRIAREGITTATYTMEP